MLHCNFTAVMLVTMYAMSTLGGCSRGDAVRDRSATEAATKPTSGIDLGNFSISLPVKNLGESMAFYEKLGFVRIGGNAKNYVIMQNATSTVGLFQGMIERTSLTFNPGWDRNSQQVPGFTDVRDLQSTLTSRGLTMTVPTDPSATGPGFIVLTDPDGNPVLIDQHVNRAK
jgi:hypothetical protein